ncbi:MAG: hypothetical protein JNL11_20015 [Bdellovibrionaceae bacterium]|nr:hypothetical protein [Pseudobdellovibrionaceae bacterium]
MKKIKYIVSFAIAVALIAFYTFSPAGNGEYSSQNSQAPVGFKEKNANEKIDILWQRIQETAHSRLPEFHEFGLGELIAMGRQNLDPKSLEFNDFAPMGWKKLLHARGSIAKVKIVSVSTKYTGIFSGADHALLRLSLTYKPDPKKPWILKRPIAPGLALKVLRDGTDSGNISALVSLEGQQSDYNFFTHPMSNIVPIGVDFGQRKVHEIFKRYSARPEELLVQDLAAVDQHGVQAPEIIAPIQLFFIPGENFNFSSDEPHDVRNDFATIKANTIIYKIYALDDRSIDKEFDYRNYTHEDAKKFHKAAIHIADIITTSEFVASEFGDSGIFFRHQMHPKQSPDLKN